MNNRKNTRIPDQCSREFHEADAIRRKQLTIARTKMDTLNQRVSEMSQKVPGLCEKKDSCEICKTARKNCKEYMDLVHQSISAWAEYEDLKTKDDCATRDAGRKHIQQQRSIPHEQAIEME